MWYVFRQVCPVWLMPTSLTPYLQFLPDVLFCNCFRMLLRNYPSFKKLCEPPCKLFEGKCIGHVYNMYFLYLFKHIYGWWYDFFLQKPECSMMVLK